MAVFNFSLPVYGFDQFSADAATNSTVGYPASGRTFSLNTNAVTTTLEIEDDDGNPVGSADNEFDDGYRDATGDGSPSNTNNNDQLLTADVTINGTDYFAGDQVELEFAFATTAGDTFWIIRIDGDNVGISGPVLPVPGTTYSTNGNIDGVEVPIADLPCFTDGAMVATPDGAVAIEDLQVGDLVITVDHGPQPIKWIGARPTSAMEIAAFPQLRPIKIARDALGPGLPDADLIVSPQHRIVVGNAKTALYFGTPEVFATAKSLINGTSIRPVTGLVPTYRHLLLEAHQVLIVNGIATESLFPGGTHVPHAQLLEQDLFGDPDRPMPRLARPMLRRFEGQLLTAA